MPVTERRARWLGAGVDIHKQPGRGRVGRRWRERRWHFQAVELPGGDQVSVNDVVETDNDRRLAQVLCMWEFTSTGSCKFRARWLVRSADLPGEVLSRLRLRSAHRPSLDASGRKATAAGANDPRSSTSVSTKNTKKGGKRDDDDGDDDNRYGEVFLTSRTDDLDLSSMTRVVMLSVAAVDTSPDSRPEAARGDLTGPRLSHAYDEDVREFNPLHVNHPLLARARARRAETIEIVSEVAVDTSADRSSRPAVVVQTCGWMPLRRSLGASGGGDYGTTALAPPPVPKPPLSAPSTHAEPSSERPATSGVERGRANPVGSRMCNKTGGDGPADITNGAHDDKMDMSADPVSDSIASENDDGVPRDGSRGPADNNDAVVERDYSGDTEPSRLPAPAVERDQEGEEPGAPPSETRGGHITSPEARTSSPQKPNSPGSKVGPRSSARSSQAPRAKAGSTRVPSPLSRLAPFFSPGRATPSRPVPSAESTTRKRKRVIRSVRREVVVDGEKHVSEAEENPLRTISVGDDHQAHIPDLLPESVRSMRAPAEVNGDEGGAQLVWGSIRDWDNLSRGILVGYLQAASAITRKSQGRPGVAVRVSLAAGRDGDNGAEKQGGRDKDGCVPWALTTGGGGDDPGVVELARPGHLRMRLPISAIQRVQSEEEALKALMETGCNLDHFEPALNNFSPQITQDSEQTWTLDQVKLLENSVQRSANRNHRGFRHMSRPGIKLDREDFIDLAAVSKIIPDKTTAQVLDFYYRFLATDRPPARNHALGTEAPNAHNRESVFPMTSGGESPSFMCPAGPSTATNAGSEQSQVGVVYATQEQAAVRTGRAMTSSREISEGVRRTPKPRRHADGKGAAAKKIEPVVLEVFDSDNHNDGCPTAGPQEAAPPAGPIVKHLRREAIGERRAPSAPRSDDDRFADGRSKNPCDRHPPQPGDPRRLSRAGQPQRLSHADDRTYGGEERCGDMLTGGGDAQRLSFRDRIDGLPALFGSMKPCWMLLKRASDYLDEDQLKYMRDLILAHARKPVSREQLLTRAMSCLEDRPHIGASFVRTFDRIDQAPTVPLHERRSPGAPIPGVEPTAAASAATPCPDNLPAGSRARTAVPLVDTRAPPAQHLSRGGQTPSQESADLPEWPSHWKPRYAASGGLLDPTDGAFGSDGQEEGGFLAAQARSRWWEEAPAGGGRSSTGGCPVE